MIPKVIHYCWFGGSPLPDLAKKCIASWERECPDYDVVQWNESNFDIGQNAFCKAAYDDRAWAFVSDYARLKVVYDNGGIYLDTDVELLRNLDPLLGHECFIGIEQNAGLYATGLGFGASKGNDAVGLMLAKYDEVEFDVARKADIACPLLNSEALRPYGYVSSEEPVDLGDLTVYPPKFFDPIAPGDTENLLCDETYSLHHYSNSWGTWKDQLRRRLIWLVGYEKVARLKKIIRG